MKTATATKERPVVKTKEGKNLIKAVTGVQTEKELKDKLEKKFGKTGVPELGRKIITADDTEVEIDSTEEFNLDSEMTEIEHEELKNLEVTIKQAGNAIGTALKAIHDKMLYREDFDTFEEYCEEKWGMSKVHAYRLMKANSIVTKLVTLCPKLDAISLPEGVIREFKNLTDDEMKKTAKIVEKPGKKITAAVVKEAVKKVKTSKSKSGKESVPKKKNPSEKAMNAFVANMDNQVGTIMAKIEDKAEYLSNANKKSLIKLFTLSLKEVNSL